MPVLFRLLCALMLVVACASMPALAHAYSTPDAYAERPSAGGGGGRWFSGSPADGLSCSVCHSSAAGQRQFPLYVAGLPTDGYELATPREIVLSWPEFAQRWTELRPDATQPPVEGTASPSIGMVAELVAESGKASGTIEIRSATATPEEQCEMTRPNLQPRLGAKLYQVRPSRDPQALLIKPDATGTLRCESRQLGQRCLIALSACGARQVRIVWTPPSTQEGPIWFSAGFVATEALSGDPTADSIQEISVPLIQSDSETGRYEEILHGGCAVARPGARASQALTWLGWSALLGLCVRRARRSRMRAHARVPACVLVAWLCTSACAEPHDVSASSYPGAGLYTPGSILGASDPTDMPAAAAGLGNRCTSLPPVVDAGPGSLTLGALQVTYRTQSLDGRYAPRNCTAVWIETPDGLYVATLEIGCALRKPGLVYWQDHTCTEKPGPDVVTSATLRDHEDEHETVWTGVDFEGKPVADGAYKLYIEVTESDKEPGEFAAFDFMKGEAPYSMPAAVAIDGPLVEVTIEWAPDTADGS